MDWANETYVKVYTRETDDDLLLTWEALALWRAMLLKFDRSGLIQTKRGARGLSALVRIPLEVVERVLPELIDDGRIRVVEAGFFAPNYIEAQEAKKSDRLRQRESREKRARNAANNDVTNRDRTSHAVTDGHSESRDVTLCLADPKRSEATRAREVTPRDGYDHEDPKQRRELAERIWREVSDRRIAIAAELGMPAPLPFAEITPATLHPSFRDLLDRIRDERALAKQACEHVLEVLTAEARKTRSLEWLAEKAFREGSWRTARSKVPTWRPKQAESDETKTCVLILNGREIEVPA